MASRDAAAKRESLPAGVSGRVVGDYEIADDVPASKRGYTTRGKEEARRKEVKFTGLVRRWEKRWVQHGHMRVFRWERVHDGAEADGADRPTRVTPTPMAEAEAGRKRARNSM